MNTVQRKFLSVALQVLGGVVILIPVFLFGNSSSLTGLGATSAVIFLIVGAPLIAIGFYLFITGRRLNTAAVAGEPAESGFQKSLNRTSHALAVAICIIGCLVIIGAILYDPKLIQSLAKSLLDRIF